MTIKSFLLILVVINTFKMLKIDFEIFLQNINMFTLQLFLLFEKSTTSGDNPRTWKYCHIPMLLKVGGVNQPHVEKNNNNRVCIRGTMF